MTQKLELPNVNDTVTWTTWFKWHSNWNHQISMTHTLEPPGLNDTVTGTTRFKWHRNWNHQI